MPPQPGYSFRERVKPTHNIKGVFLDDFLIKMKAHADYFRKRVEEAGQPGFIARDMELNIVAPTFNVQILELFEHVMGSLKTIGQDAKGLTAKELSEIIKNKVGAQNFEDVFTGRANIESRVEDMVIFHGFHEIWEYFLQSLALSTNKSDVSELREEQAKALAKRAKAYASTENCPLSEGYGVVYLMSCSRLTQKTQRSMSDEYYEAAISSTRRRFTEEMEVENAKELGSPSAPQYRAKLKELIESRLQEISERSGFPMPAASRHPS